MSGVTLDSLRSLPSLRTLDMSKTSLTNAQFLIGLPESLRILNLNFNNTLTEDIFPLLPRELHTLKVAGIQVTLEGIDKLPPALTELILSSQNVQDESCRYFPRTLRKLSLYRCRVSDNGLAYLPPSIEELDLSWNPISDQGLVSLMELPQLRQLNVSHTFVTQEKLLELEKAFRGTIIKGPKLFCQ